MSDFLWVRETNPTPRPPQHPWAASAEVVARIAEDQYASDNEECTAYVSIPLDDIVAVSVQGSTYNVLYRKQIEGDPARSTLVRQFYESIMTGPPIEERLSRFLKIYGPHTWIFVRNDVSKDYMCYVDPDAVTRIEAICDAGGRRLNVFVEDHFVGGAMHSSHEEYKAILDLLERTTTPQIF